MTKKKKYELPRTEVVDMRVTNQLLAGSEGLNKPSDYEGGGDPINS